jgi:Cd2+/Zn2+-exporting ATPase
LVISTPVSIVTAIGHAARNGVLIKGGVYLEEAGALSAIAFDKTGTLTKGVPEVTDIITIHPASGPDHPPEWLHIAAVIEKGSSHPLATAIVRHAEKQDLDLSRFHVESFQSITGKGLEATVNHTTYYIGSPGLISERLPHVYNQDLAKNIETLQQEGKTVMVVATSESVLGLIAVRDDMRTTSYDTIQTLHGLGIKKTIMLTGDNPQTAKVIGDQLGITEVKAGLLPQDKLEVIKQLQRENQKVAMVGDGVNDAPALAASTVGVAMGGAGTDTALETADIVLMADDISKLPFTIRLSRKTVEIIKQNIAFSLGIKLMAMAFIFCGWLPLGLAVLADVGATLIVTLNSMRLARTRPR